MEHVDELIAGHALRALSSEDEERVVVHLAECERCRRRLRETEAVAASLAYGVPQVAPPPELRSRVLAIAEPVVAAPAAAPAAEPAARPAPARPRRQWWPRFAAVAVRPWRSPSWACWRGTSRSKRREREPRQPGERGGGDAAGRRQRRRPDRRQRDAVREPAAGPGGKTYEAWVIRGSVAPGGCLPGRRDGRASPDAGREARGQDRRHDRAVRRLRRSPPRRRSRQVRTSSARGTRASPPSRRRRRPAVRCGRRPATERLELDDLGVAAGAGGARASTGGAPPRAGPSARAARRPDRGRACRGRRRARRTGSRPDRAPPRRDSAGRRGRAARTGGGACSPLRAGGRHA